MHQQAQELASATGLKAPEYREKADRIKSGLQEMQQNHDAFIGSLNTDQRTEMKGRIRKIEQLRSAVNSRVAEIDKDLRSPAPDSKRVAGCAKQLQKVIEDWQKQYKGIGEEMGVEGCFYAETSVKGKFPAERWSPIVNPRQWKKRDQRIAKTIVFRE